MRDNMRIKILFSKIEVINLAHLQIHFQNRKNLKILSNQNSNLTFSENLKILIHLAVIKHRTQTYSKQIMILLKSHQNQKKTYLVLLLSFPKRQLLFPIKETMKFQLKNLK